MTGPSDRRGLDAAWMGIVLLAVVAFAIWWMARANADDAGDADQGRLTERQISRPEDVPALDLAESTTRWRLTAIGSNTPPGLAAGGLALHDLDGDDDLDLVVARGTLDILFWDQDTFSTRTDVVVVDAVAIDVADLDGDGFPDLLVARAGPVDSIIWGGDWLTGSGQPDVTDLAGTQPSAALQAAELTGDGIVDVVRLGRGAGGGEPDVLWRSTGAGERSFEEVPLGADSRLSLSAEIFDVDDDGLNDVWVTRDVGWDTGPDSVYSRRGEPAGAFVDIAPDIGADLAIDGMGITVADLNGDARLDVYASDLGDNEMLVRTGDGFVRVADTGAARIRPPDAPDDVISSSWASGAADLNLDGRLDLVVVNGGFAAGLMRNKVLGTDVAVVDPPSILLGHGDGTFSEGWTELGFEWTTSGRGLTIGDVDDDGDDDLIMLSDDGSLRSFENRSDARSVTIAVADTCDGTGATVTSADDRTLFTTLLRRHTYNGVHSTAVTVGLPGMETNVSVAWPGRDATVIPTSDSANRQRVVVRCPGH